MIRVQYEMFISAMMVAVQMNKKIIVMMVNDTSSSMRRMRTMMAMVL